MSVDKIKTYERKYHQDFVEILEYLTQHPEIGQKEHLAAEYLEAYLRKQGFSVESNFMGYSTAFKAEFKNGEGPKVCFLAKYDALPHFDSEGKHAHGCGHNWVAAWAIGAATILSKMADDFSGTVAVIGSPPEDFFGDQIKVLRSDYFKECDIVFSAHLNDRNLLHSFARPINTLEFVFQGKDSQAFAWPELGINAVDAMVDSIVAIRNYRGQGEEDDRINYIIAEGGKKASQIPDKAVLRLAVGADNKARTDQISRDICEIARQNAEKYGATFESKLYNEFRELNNISLVHEVIMSSFDAFGEPYDIYPQVLGRTQLDNSLVSFVAPMIYMFFGVEGWTSHQPSIQRIAASHSEDAKRKLGTAIGIFVDAALKFYHDPELVKQVRNKFEQKDFINQHSKHDFVPYQKA